MFNSSGVAAGHGDHQPEVEVLVDDPATAVRAGRTTFPSCRQVRSVQSRYEARRVGGVLGRREHRSGHDGGADQVQCDEAAAARSSRAASQRPENMGDRWPMPG